VAVILVGVGGGILYFMHTGEGEAAVTLGMITSYIPLLGRFYNPIRQFFSFYNIIQRGLASAERVFEFLDNEPDIQDEAHAPLVEFPAGRVEFQDVTFGYDPDEPVIKDLSFAIEPGQVAAIVGTTGAGKSTVVNLLMRFYEPQQGRIIIDGHDISHIQMDSLVHAIGMVFQETFLFYGTLAENIDFSRGHSTRQEIHEAARLANIEEFIRTLPKGYDTMVGERGTTLSGGQRQRIAIARMILKDPDIVVLDEATSAVDNKTEKLIQDSLDHLMEGRTSIVIAHRLSTISSADVVLVMEHGRLVEFGAPEELVDTGGRFAEMMEMANF
jgi:ABC-type multidrug transport system fused ATPase/permease subunit